jgi:hypothetical protein
MTLDLYLVLMLFMVISMFQAVSCSLITVVWLVLITLITSITQGDGLQSVLKIQDLIMLLLLQ